MKHLLTFIIAFLPFISSAQSTKLLEIDASSFAPVQTDVLSGVAIDKIGTDPSRRPCARIKMHVNRMNKEEINGLSVRTVGGSIVVTKCVVASEGNGLIIELTAKSPTRFYLHHEKYGDSNEVSLNLEGNKEYRIEASLNTTYSIVVLSNVSEAEVYIDGEYKGVTDKGNSLTVKDVYPGKHSIKVVRGSFTETLPVEVNSDNVFFRLNLETGQLKRHVVTFKIAPSGAQLKIDGEVYAENISKDFPAPLLEGEHLYSVSAGLYHEEKGTIVVNAPDLVKEIKLKPAYGWLQVSGKGDLNEASVYIDGKFIGKAPIKTGKLSSGEHVIRIEQNQYKPLEQKIIISDLQTLDFTPVLDPDFAIVELRSVSNDGDIYVNDEYKGPSPWTGRLLFGTYTLEVRKSGHQSKSIVQQITPQSSSQIKLPDPSPILGRLDVASQPSGADIYVDNQYIGKTPMQFEFLVGEHELSIQKEGFLIDSRKVEINKNEQINVAATLYDAVDLSSEGAANCYIIVNSGKYTFPTVKGNSTEPVGMVASAEVLWESFGTSKSIMAGDLISNVSYSNGVISFQTNKKYKEGNAVIAAKDAKGRILWSWHIWFTDQPQGQEYFNNVGTMMDRNLGATSAKPGDVGALGLFYQWGRKDPFLGSSSIKESIVAKSTIVWPSVEEPDSTCNTIEYAIANPTVFIKYNKKNLDWHYTGVWDSDNTRWTTSDKPKSIYDPCPAGWRIPDAVVWGKAESAYLSFNSSKKGCDFSKEIGPASDIWYPASGYINNSESSLVGSLSKVGNYGNYWSASPYAYNQVFELSFFDSGNIFVIGHYRANGCSVRCVKYKN